MKRKWVYNSYIQTFFWDHRQFQSFKIKVSDVLSTDIELLKWCAENNCKIIHTWVECPDDETAMLFAMRWVE